MKSEGDRRMLISNIDPDMLTPEQFVTLLYPGEPLESEIYGDCIMVFGYPELDRAEKAIKLYKEGRAPYLLFSGGNKWGERDESEAIKMKNLALDHGVPEEAILIETLSNHTKENVLASLLVLDRKIGLHNIRRLISVTTPGHTRRCLLSLQTYMPNWIEHILVSSDMVMPENWWNIPPIRNRAEKEVRNLIRYIKEGQLVDMEIQI